MENNNMTTSRFRVIPYRRGSRGATSLARGLGGLCLRIDGTSRYVPRPTDTIINWGSTDIGSVHFARGYPRRILNLPNIVRQASNKLHFFRTMSERGLQNIIPEYWENTRDIPDEVFEGDGMVVCRTTLAGHSGEGIVLASSRAELVPAPLYVKYIKKQQEFRVHVGRGQSIISLQRKARRVDVENPNWQIRNHANGFIYAREGVEAPPPVLDSAIAALDATGLDFGAVDVIWNERHQRAYVLEINTAPGLEGTTVEDYVRFFTAL